MVTEQLYFGNKSSGEVSGFDQFNINNETTEILIPSRGKDSYVWIEELSIASSETPTWSDLPRCDWSEFTYSDLPALNPCEQWIVEENEIAVLQQELQTLEGLVKETPSNDSLRKQAGWYETLLQQKENRSLELLATINDEKIEIEFEASNRALREAEELRRRVRNDAEKSKGSHPSPGDPAFQCETDS